VSQNNYPQQFVRDLHLTFLRHEPDEKGWQWWTEQVGAQWQNKQAVMNDFANTLAYEETAKTPYRETFWLIGDHLGTPRLIAERTGKAEGIKRRDFLPFGEEIQSGTGGRTTAQGYGGQDNIRQKFTLYERDDETGLDYAQARYYASGMGRFVSVDPYTIVAEVQHEKDPDKANRMLEEYLSQPQKWNRYSYVQNNPLRYIDPSGEDEVLTGSEADQKKALARLRAELGEDRWKYVAVSQASIPNVDGDSNGRVTVLSISKSDLAAFSQIGDDLDNRIYSEAMGNILASSEHVEFRVSNTFVDKDGDSHKVTGGSTVPASVSKSGNIQIFVSKNALKEGNAAFRRQFQSGNIKTDDGKQLVLRSYQEVDAHEHGHAYDFLRGKNENNSIKLENAIKSRMGVRQRRIRE
jgi:RHS repeat-associated protein